MSAAQARRLLRAWAPALGMMTLILGFSSLDGAPLALPEVPHLDKVIHASVYACLGALLLRALWLTDRRMARSAVWLPVVLLVAGFGALDEVYQSFVPFRSTDPLDWLADSLGGATGAALMLGFRRWRTPPGA